MLADVDFVDETTGEKISSFGQNPSEIRYTADSLKTSAAVVSFYVKRRRNKTKSPSFYQLHFYQLITQKDVEFDGKTVGETSNFVRVQLREIRRI